MKTKEFLSLLCVLLMMLATSCSTTRKVSTASTQTQLSQQSQTDTHTSTTATDAVATHLTQTDKSNIVIDFTKIEYADGTFDIVTREADDADSSTPTAREQTEPPNAATGGIKSVTTGRVTINNDKKTESDTLQQSTETTESDISESASVNEATNVETSVKEQSIRTYFRLGVALGIAVVLCIVYLLYRHKLKSN